MVPKVVGVKGGRKVVRPTSGGVFPSASAAMRSALMLLDLPWSVAIPLVV